MRVLVTGAAGNIGRRTVDTFAHYGHEVTAVDIARHEYPKGVEPHAIDLLDQPVEMEALVARKRPDAIVHLAALVGAACDGQAEKAWALNAGVTARLANLAVETGVPKFVFTSSAAVYPRDKGVAMNEDGPIRPPILYGETKVAAEEAILEAASNGGETDFTMLRVFNVYGHGIPKSLIERLRTASPCRPVILHGWQKFGRDYVHVDDVAEALELATVTPREGRDVVVANIGSGVMRTNAMLVDEMSGLGVRPHYEWNHADQPDYSLADITRATELFGFDPSTALILDR